MDMPAWGEALDEKQIRALVIFLREKKAERETEQVRRTLVETDGVFSASGQRFMLEEVGHGKGLLWSIDFMPGGALLVTQRDGVLWHFDGEKRTAVEGTPEVWQHGQGGLLEVALHPDYADNGWVYLSYSENTGATENGKEAGMTTVVRGRIVDGRWTDQERLFRADGEHHTSSGAHYGSRFVFDDGYLFFAIGIGIGLGDNQR